MGDEKAEDVEDNAYFYEEHLKFMLPEDNVHKDVIDLENLIHGFASIPLYDRVGIPVEDLPDEMRQEMESSAAMHNKKYLEKRVSQSKSISTKPVAQPKKRNVLSGSNPSESLIRGLYGNDFSSDCLKYLMSHSSKPLPINDIVFDDDDMAVEEKDSKLWKKEFNEFVCKFDGDPDRTVAIISSEESELSEEFDEGYEETCEMVERFERLGKIINASASMVMKQKKNTLTQRTLNMDFDDVPYDANKTYPHEIPIQLRNIELNAQERERRRIARNRIRQEREKKRLQRLSLSKSVPDDHLEQELLPHPSMEAPDTSAEPKEKKKSKIKESKSKRSSSSDDEDDLQLLEWKANQNTKSKIAKDKHKRSNQVRKSMQKKGLF